MLVAFSSSILSLLTAVFSFYFAFPSFHFGDLIFSWFIIWVIFWRVLIAIDSLYMYTGFMITMFKLTRLLGLANGVVRYTMTTTILVILIGRTYGRRVYYIFYG